MSFSLLYKIREDTEPSSALYDLSVDRAVEMFCPDRRRAEYFTRVLSCPLQNTSNIIYRQDILADLNSCAGLFDDLKLHFTRYDKIKNDWRELRQSAAGGGGAINREVMLGRTFASLKITAMFPSTIVSFYSSLLEMLDKYQIKSEGLFAIRSYCEEMLANNSLAEIVRIAGLFQYRSLEDYTFDAAITYDATLRLAQSELSGISLRDGKQGMIAKLFKRRQNDDGTAEILPDDGEADFTADITSEDAEYALGCALHRIDEALNSITDSIYENFFGLSSELMFYEAALLYCDFAAARSFTLCIPEVLGADCDFIELHNLRDLILAVEGKRAEDIVPNSIMLDEKREGIIVRGKNNTGKTVFLRSVGIAQLFSQAGLPVCAEKARLSLRGAIFSHFSSAEEDFMAGDAAGRFDGEVKEVANIIDSLRPHSLILLNETFQTTAYDEGTEAISAILEILPRTGAKFIFVTHLPGLFERCDPERVKLLASDTGFRINAV